MICASAGVFLDNRCADDRGPATHVKQYGGAELADAHDPLWNCQTPMAPQPDGAGRTGNASRTPITPHQGVGGVLPFVHSAAERKDKPMLALRAQSDSQCLDAGCTMSRLAAHEGLFHDTRSPCVGRGAEQDRDSSDTLGNESAVSLLEEQLCLEDLQQLICFFSLNYEPPPPRDYISKSKSSTTCVDGSVAIPTRNNSRITCDGANGNAKGEGKQRANLSRKSNTTSVAAEPKQLPRTALPSRSDSAAATEMNGKTGVVSRLRNNAQCVFETREELQHALRSYGRQGHKMADSYTRVLTEDEFVRAFQYVVPSALDTEIMDLMKRVDYEAKGLITWDDFADFLVSQVRHRSNLSQGLVGELLTIPEPESCLPSSQHINGTCMEADRQRNILLTGGSEGTVRAWNLETMAAYGVIFDGGSWVIGVHWASYIQGIIIVTIDRRVVILDSKTLEVKRLFRGRAVVDSAEGYMYAHDSVETVNVSGMTNPSFRKYFCHSFALYAGSDTADNRKRKEGKKKAMGTRPTTLAGPTKMPIQCRIEECTLAGLVDAVTCSLYHRTALKEDMLILATSVGEVRFYSIPITTRRVVVPHAVVRPHEKRINKMCIYYSCSALLTASDDGLVKMISLDSGALLRTFPSAGAQPHAAVHDFDVNPKLRLIVTVGPERHGVVWDFSHDAPMATLDSHNGPCCCCCMSVRQKQIVTVGVDGSVFIFDTQGFRLMQIINVDRLNPQRVMFDKSELRLLCLATYPYFHGRNHHAALSYSTKYKGHMAPMVGVLYNRAYDMIVTIDTEGLVMMWKRATGAAAFTFQLKDFSDSAVMNAARLTCFALDGLERRLLTGFHNGVTAVWNLMNGQTTNVITAAAENFNTSCPNPEVTALGTLTRDGITFFIFASAGRLYTTRESSIFTIASANKWEIPTSLGDVVSILPVSPYCIACGTSYGAMFFYRVMAGRQEGSALWVIESTESIRRSLNFQTLDGRRDQPASFLTSRIIKIFPLQAVGPHIFMAVHMDGTVVLWHTLRRLMMSTLNVRSALAQKGTEQSLSHVEVDHENEYLIFADNHSNIHVCSMEFCPVHDDVDTETLRVPVLQTTEGSQMACWPGSPFDRDVIARDIQMREERKKERERETSPMGSASRARDQDGRSGNVSEKTQYTFVRFFRECVFHSGFNSLSGLSLLDSSDEGVETSENALSEFIPQQDMVKEVEQSANELGNDGGSGIPNKAPRALGTSSVSDERASTLPCSVLSWSARSNKMIVASSGSDNLTRAFTLDGMIVGECGMNTWVVGKPFTYMFLGNKPSMRLPAHGCPTNGIDLIAELKSLERPSTSYTKRGRSGRSFRVGMQASDTTLQHDNVPRSNPSPFPDILHGSQGGGGVTLLEASVADRSQPFPQPAEITARGDNVPKARKQQQLLLQEQRKDEKGALREPFVRPQAAKGTLTLSTYLRSRRPKEELLRGLVKSKFIDFLRGVPVVDAEDDSVLLQTPHAPSVSSRSIARNDQSTDSAQLSHMQVSHGIMHSSSQHSITDCFFPSETMPMIMEGRPGAPYLVSGQGNNGNKNSIDAISQGGRQTRNQRCTSQMRKRSAIVPTEGEATPMTTVMHPISILPSVCNSDEVIPCESESPRGDLLQNHIDSQRRVLIALGCTDPVLNVVPHCGSEEHSSRTAGVSGQLQGDLASGLSNQYLNSSRLRNTHQMDSKSLISKVTSKLYIAHVEEMLPPKGTRTREEAAAWSEKMKKIHAYQ